MILDELIEQLQQIKRDHPLAGRAKVIRYSKKYREKEFLGAEYHNSNEIVLDFL